jgi:outer membrane protein OmpA-like peptidoglycan-associated protein
MIRVASLALFGIFALLTFVHAQSTDEIKKALAPQPTFRGLPDLNPDPTKRGVTIVEPSNAPAPSIDLHIPFDFNSDQLTPDAIIILRRLGEALKDPSFANSRFRIAGHTDAKGTAEYNQKLSERRAQAVRNYLIFQYDIDSARLDAIGYGLTQLADPAHPEDGINRRVQIINLGTGSAASRP